GIESVAGAAGGCAASAERPRQASARWVSQRPLGRERRRRQVFEQDRRHLLDKGSRGPGAARLVLPARRSAREPLVLVRRTLGDAELARGAGLIHALLDALFGMPDALGELAAVRRAESARRTGRHVVLIERLEP